jgi:hypothetical protein
MTAVIGSLKLTAPPGEKQSQKGTRNSVNPANRACSVAERIQY